MSALRQKLARVGARAGLLAGASAAVLALSGIGASSALAAPSCVNGSLNIQGKGASLQRVSQELWTGRKVPSNEILGLPHEKTSGGYAADCSAAGDDTVSYTSTGSGPGLKAFRFTGSGSIEHEFAYIGSDDPPTRSQIENAEGAGGGAKPVIFPVAQTAIAIVVHLPSGCEINGGITWTDLNKVFAGTITHWNELSTDNGNAACSAAIERVVRSEGSGTTFQFKNYLSVLETGHSGEGPGCSLGTWAALRPIENAETGAPNTTWPSCSGRSPIHAAAGGGAVAEYVKNNVDTIGYAALPDARGKGATTVPLQNGTELGSPSYGTPEEGEALEEGNEKANCGSRVYEVPAEGRKEGSNTGIAVDWSSTFGAVPTIGGEFFPLCTLTFDVGWTNYEAAGYGIGSNATLKPIVHDYLANYVLGSEGQANITGHYYAPLPHPAEKKFNVLEASQFAAINLE